MSPTRLTDFIYAFRLLYLIQRPWVEQDAYRFGIIDANGKTLRKWSELKTSEEKDSYTYFHRLAFNMKRMLQKVPGFENRFLQVAAAMKLLKEETEFNDHVFTDEEIQFIGQRLMNENMINEDTPTNVTGGATDMSVPKPLKPDVMARRQAEMKRQRKIQEGIDPMSAIILGLGAIAAFPIAKKVAAVIEPIVDYILSNKKEERDKTEVLKKVKLARDMASKASGEEKKKLLDLISKLEKQLNS